MPEKICRGTQTGPCPNQAVLTDRRLVRCEECRKVHRSRLGRQEYRANQANSLRLMRLARKVEPEDGGFKAHVALINKTIRDCS